MTSIIQKSRVSNALHALRAAAACTLLAWLLKEFVHFRRWKIYWACLRRVMRSRTLSTDGSVALNLDKLQLLSDLQLQDAGRGLLFGKQVDEVPLSTLHRSLAYLQNRRHPSQVSLKDTVAPLARLRKESYASIEDRVKQESKAIPQPESAAVEASVFAAGPPVWPMPWIVCTVSHLVRPLASAASLPRSAGNDRRWEATREDSGVSVLWRDRAGSSSTPWLLLHGIGGVDRRCVEGLVHHCQTLHGCQLILPIHPNWESYCTCGAEAVWKRGSPHIVTTRKFMRIVGEALLRHDINRVHVLAWSLGTCFATMLHEEYPSIELDRVVFIDPAAAFPLASSAWRWLLESRPSQTISEFRERNQRLGLSAWMLQIIGATAADNENVAWSDNPGRWKSTFLRLVDALLAIILALGIQFDHLRVAPELHPCAHGCDLEGKLLNRSGTLLLLDSYDTFLCAPDHLDYLRRHCQLVKVRWRRGWHCGWMYGRLWREAGKDLGHAIDEWVCS